MDKRTEEEKIADPRDWRGTPILVGSPVIYGGPVGRSIQLVEAEVVGFSKTGRVNVKIVRRAYSRAWPSDKRIVHVGQDRLVVVKSDGLPPTTLPTWEQEMQEAEDRRNRRDRNYETHTWPPSYVEQVRPGPRSTFLMDRYVYPPCSVCGLETREGYDKECVGG